MCVHTCMGVLCVCLHAGVCIYVWVHMNEQVWCVCVFEHNLWDGAVE